MGVKIILDYNSLRYKKLQSLKETQTLCTINTYTGRTFTKCLILDINEDDILFKSIAENIIFDIVMDIHIIESIYIKLVEDNITTKKE